MAKKAETTGKHAGGRPRKYDTAADLQAAIDDYFANGVTQKTVIVGKGANKQAVKIEVPTITGLCYFLGFESRQSFYDLEKQDEFSYTIKRARLFIEQEYEEQLQQGNTTGAIFALKNFGWQDKQDHDITTGGKPIQIVTFGQAIDHTE